MTQASYMFGAAPTVATSAPKSLFTLCFDTGSHQVFQAGFELTILPQYLSC